MYLMFGKNLKKNREEISVNFEAEILVRDTIKLNILKEIKEKTISLAFQMNDGNVEDYITQIHNENSRVKVYGNFNISESIDGDILTIRPVSVGNSLKCVITFSGDVSEKSVSIIRNADKKEENAYKIDKSFQKFELIPSEDKYILNLAYSDEIQMKEKILKIEQEYKKDYDSAKSEVEGLKQQIEIDKSILEYYKDKDVKPIEDIIREITEKIDEAEKQIALFIIKKKKKTMEIEGVNS